MASKSPKKTQNKPALNTRAVQGHTTPTRLVEHKTAQQVMYAGPIPPPEILAELKKIHPESVDIVFKIAEREQNNHIRESEERHTRACLQTSYRSQISEAARHTKAAKTSASLS